MSTPPIPRRLWPTIDLPGIATGRSTYWPVDLDAMPPIERALDGDLGWLLDAEAQARYSLERGPADAVAREANADGLATMAFPLSLPASFKRFIEDPEPRRHIRSATACYLDLGDFPVTLGDGALIHFLSDQQWVLHWLLWVGPDYSEAVIATSTELGFAAGEHPIRTPDPGSPEVALAVCADSFEQFLYRFWAMNELFFRLAVDTQPLGALPAELRDYARRYPRRTSPHDLFGFQG